MTWNWRYIIVLLSVSAGLAPTMVPTVIGLMDPVYQCFVFGVTGNVGGAIFLILSFVPLLAVASVALWIVRLFKRSPISPMLFKSLMLGLFGPAKALWLFVKVTHLHTIASRMKEYPSDDAGQEFVCFDSLRSHGVPTFSLYFGIWFVTTVLLFLLFLTVDRPFLVGKRGARLRFIWLGFVYFTFLFLSQLIWKYAATALQIG
jgi:hypothetical protein